MRPYAALFACLALGTGCNGYGVPKWFSTCGDAICTGYRPPTGVPRCTDESPGMACPVEGAQCDPGDECNRLIVCAARDPRLAGCPISSRRFKRDVQYLTDAQREECARQVDTIRLARYRYQGSDETRLGFVLEDDPPAASVDRGRDMVDLYGYSSLAVAALQVHERRIEALERELRELRAAVRRERGAKTRN
jgi:hypothetical protein